MTRNDGNDFQIRPGRTSNRASGGRRLQLFETQVKIAIRKAGGDFAQIGRAHRPMGHGRRNGRFNARGRGAKLMASLSKEERFWQADDIGRFRSRRVVVKARVVKLDVRHMPSHNAPRLKSRALDAHLNYLERDGVTRNGEKGKVYSADDDEADGKAFVGRGQGDRHQFRFIVSPEDSLEIADLRALTRNLMQQLEIDLQTRLDWIAIDHHNTGHPHTHVLVRGVTEDNKILNIAGDYISYGVRYRASELVTRELGYQSEIEVQAKLQEELEAERWTRLDKMLLAVQRDHGVIDLRPEDRANGHVRKERSLMVGRAKWLESYGLAEEVESGKWALAARTEVTLRGLEEHNGALSRMQQALVEHELAETFDIGQYVRHGGSIREQVIGRVLAKGLADDEMGERIYIVLDGMDGRLHYIELADRGIVEEVRSGMIVEIEPGLTKQRSDDQSIASHADRGIYHPSRHLARIKDSFERDGRNPEVFVRALLSRLEVLRRAGHIERLDEDSWRVPSDMVERGRSYDLSQGNDRIRLRILSALDLEEQIISNEGTWLDRKLLGEDPSTIANTGFGRQVSEAVDRRGRWLVGLGLAEVKDGKILISHGAVAALERREVARVGRAMASVEGRHFQSLQPGDAVKGTLIGATNLSSGRFAVIESFSGPVPAICLVPWQPELDDRIGQRITGVMHMSGGVGWNLERKRELGL
jgi:type IV secretory pathway VirD2 relaxase